MAGQVFVSNVPKGAEIYVNVDSYGNTSAASVIIALSEAYSKGYIKNGSRVLLAAFGAGLTWGTAILQF